MTELAEKRIPCPHCKEPVVDGARKCRACKGWIDPGIALRVEPRFPRVAAILATAVAATMVVIVSARESPVGEAPPLTALPTDSASAAAISPAAFGPDPETVDTARPAAERRWRIAKELKVGDAHPLSIAFAPKGESIYVSGDDATVREVKLKNGEVIHQASVQAQGDEIRVLFGRWIAVLRHTDASRIPVMDTTAWDRDPVMLDVGRSPGDVVALPDGKSVLAATTDGRRVSRFELPSGARIANITLPHATGQLFVLRAEGRPYVAAMGTLFYGGRPAGAWLDVFDPAEQPFGATRRSIAVGREPREGAVTADGSGVFFPDRDSNTATLLRIGQINDTKSVAVGQTPEEGYLLGGDRFGITISSAARTATVVELATMRVSSTLMLSGTPRTGATSADGKTLFVVLGGRDNPPKGSGVAVITGDPPRVVASLPTGEGAAAVAVSPDGNRAAVANWADKTVTLLER